MNAASDATLRMPPLRRLRLSTKASDRSVSARTLRSMTASCWARSSLSAAPVSPAPALLTITSGSRPCRSSASAISCAAPVRATSAERIVGPAPFSAIASASATSAGSRLATRRSS